MHTGIVPFLSYRALIRTTTAEELRGDAPDKDWQKQAPTDCAYYAGNHSTDGGADMCGIVGYVGCAQAVPILLGGLSRLEYRGYDSAGVAVHGERGIEIVKTGGRLERLAAMLGTGHAVSGCCGIGHTRWATHGKPDTCNAHPHASPGNRVVAVHNGIIENHRELASRLREAGYTFRSRTDTEAAVLLLHSLYSAPAMQDLPPEERALRAIRGMTGELHGSYAMGILFGDQPDALYAVRKDSPLAVGMADGLAKGHMIASDITAMLGVAERVAYLGDGEIACLTAERVRFIDAMGREVEKSAERIGWNANAADKSGYDHYMLKEIDEQPRAVRETIAPRIRADGQGKRIDLSAEGLSDEALSGVSRLYLIGCGSAYHAACVGKAVTEQLSHVPCDAELASEFRYGKPALDGRALAVIISQSGETADSLAALRLCRARGVRTLAVVNVAGSSMSREADAVSLTCAGPEISVATTKAYSAQLAALYLLAVRLAAARGAIDRERENRLADALLELPDRLAASIAAGACVRMLAGDIARCGDVFFIGRGLDHAVCMEGSLKLKEVAYIHAEAFAAGEIKHGTISLIEEGVPVIGVATQKALLPKTLSNLAEVKSRGAKTILVVPGGWAETVDHVDFVVDIPDAEPLFAASLAVIPLQLLAYHVSCAKGLDVDKPRNLAKSVTVE